MPNEIDLAPDDWRLDHNFFWYDARNFERDAHVLVLGALDAGVKYLDAELEKVNAEYKAKEGSVDPEHEDWFINDYQGATGALEDQKRFLRNMAAVGLLALLTHALNELALRAENSFGPRDPKGYGEGGDDEFKRLWCEYRDRFGINVSPRHIQWITGLRKARNYIVHQGGEANPALPAHKIDENTPFNDLWDTTFSRKYPKYVQGRGFSAEVNVPQEELDKCVDKAVELVKWLAGALREKQLAHVREARAHCSQAPARSETGIATTQTDPQPS